MTDSNREAIARIIPQHEGCPFGGTHKIGHWSGYGRKGVVCVQCHKTWTATAEGFDPTWPTRSIEVIDAEIAKVSNSISGISIQGGARELCDATDRLQALKAERAAASK